MDKKNTRILYYDILNIAACFCVIWLHCNGCVHTFSKGKMWATSLIVETIAYWAVPVFFMLSGATLMNYRKKYDTKTFFKKRIIKTVLPFIFWSITVLIWRYFTKQIHIENITVKNIINILLLNKEESVYWFFWALFSVYLSIPVLSLLTEEKNRKILWYIVVIASIFNSVPKLLVLFGVKWNGDFVFPVAGGYIIYVVLGYLLSTQNIKKKYRIIIYILGIVSALIRYFGTFYLSNRDGVINKSLWGYTFFTGLFLSVAVFVFIKNINYDGILKNKKVTDIIGKISSCSFGIYLIHIMVMYYETRFLNIDTHSCGWRTVGSVGTYIVALCIIYILKKIPIIKKIVP